MINPLKIIKNGILTENPTFVLVLGMCPTIAVTTSAINGLGMGLAATAVLMGSNMAISAIRKCIPDEIRIPAFIVVIAGFVTVVQLLISAYAPALNKSLGIFIPLIVVNCIILARAEAYAYKNGVIASMFDASEWGSASRGADTDRLDTRTARKRHRLRRDGAPARNLRSGPARNTRPGRLHNARNPHGLHTPP